MNNIPNWSITAMNNMPFLYRELQDISIYVEDTAEETEAFYTKMIALLAPNLKIRKIFMLGSRKNVITAVKEANDIQNKLYIIDGDLDLFYNTTIKLDGLFRSQVYCVENYIVSQKSMATILEESYGTITHEQACNSLAWNDFIKNLVIEFENIYILYGIAHRLNKILVRIGKAGSQISTIARFNSHWVLYTCPARKPNTAVIEQEMASLEAEILTYISETKLEQWKQQIFQKFAYLTDYQKIDYFSAKTYLMPFIQNYLNFKGVNMRAINKKSLKYRLLSSSNHPKLLSLQQAIHQIIQTGKYTN